MDSIRHPVWSWSDPRPGVCRRAFALIELLVVIAIIVILAGLLLPTLARSTERGRRIACLNNLRQLQICWHTYADENDGVLPPNNWVFSAETLTIYSQSYTWAAGNTRTDTNTFFIETGLLFPYNKSVSIYHCPADKSTIETPTGQKLPQLRTRSYNMSGSVNCSNTLSYQRYTDILAPPPSKFFVFIEPHEDVILAGHFGVIPKSYPGGYRDWWLDAPTGRHNQGGNLSFADGHAERWKWAWPKHNTRPLQPTFNEIDLSDLRRIQDASRDYPQ